MSGSAQNDKGAVGAAPGRGKAVRFGFNLNYLFLAPATIYVLAMAVYPLVYNVQLSLRDVTARALIRGDAKFVGFDNYRRVFASSEMWQSLGFSLFYTTISVVLILVVGFWLAMLLRRSFPGSGALRAVILLAWILPSVVSGNVFRWMFDGDTGIVNFVIRSLGYPGNVYWLTNEYTAMAGVIIATVWSGAPLAMLLMVAGLLAISESLYEAARIDGATAWERTRYITIPMLRPVILTAAMLSFIYTFKTFDTIYIMTRGGPASATKVVPIYAYEQAFQYFRFGEGAVATTLLLIVPLAIAVVYYLMIRKEQHL
ncbi:sugar ABC transporter permease [Rhizobium sp. TRM96647]|uniref:carbohydrate ABC transporter permease n=1 Tax=unclassified Rhizobium TaxID=2613769 RepID=UPI0021E83B59|nr:MULTISPECIES: sugar ABC transporter permease [unclassified Rhizobium]MCV3739227.1 sugar ABC transporter permease [Rhizobium sp. TRM96647]MCV3760895.1 sugar ABC transporter permease [Rhizobium sp. TRM96650]